MDVEDVKASYFDIMRMVGEIVISNPGTQIFKKRVDERAVPGISEDCWKQTPGKIMFGNSLSWTAIISLPYKRNRDGDYLIERTKVQPRLPFLFYQIECMKSNSSLHRRMAASRSRHSDLSLKRMIR